MSQRPDLAGGLSRKLRFLWPCAWKCGGLEDIAMLRSLMIEVLMWSSEVGRHGNIGHTVQHVMALSGVVGRPSAADSYGYQETL